MRVSVNKRVRPILYGATCILSDKAGMEEKDLQKQIRVQHLNQRV